MTDALPFVCPQPKDFFVIDIETSSFDSSKAEICEFAALEVSNYQPLTKLSSLVAIEGDISKEAYDKHHIAKSDLIDAPSLTSSMQALADYIGTDAILVGHNIDTYDIPILKRAFDSCGLTFSYSASIDTLTLAKKLWPDSAHDMDSLRVAMELDSEGAHRAEKDCRDELEVFNALRDGQVIHAKSVRPKVSPFAKYKRTDLTEITTENTNFDENHPLYGKCVIFSDFSDDDRVSLTKRLVGCGGHSDKGLTQSRTDILVVPTLDTNTGKVKDAKKFNQGKRASNPIEIIDLVEFECRLNWN